MFRATAFPSPRNSVCMLTLSSTQTNTCHSLPFTSNAHSLFVSSSIPFDSRFKFQQFHQPLLNLSAVHGTGLGVAALKNKRGEQGGNGFAGMDDFEDDDDILGSDVDDGDDDDEDDDKDDDDDVLGSDVDDGDDDDEDDDKDHHDDVLGSDVDDGDDDEDDDKEAVLPSEETRKWYKNKPRGFGEGKVYDTSVEDKLLDKMHKSREAQAANLNKLKNNPRKPKANKSDQKKTELEAVPTGVRVRLVNLPKKKNIHRDLKSALQGIPDIINIVPAVAGNKKTRDSVCKGFAFVDFKHEDDAVRFVQLYSGQTITFGKIQKQIKCELLNEQPSSSASLELSKNLNSASHLMVEENSNEDSNIDNSALSSWDGAASDDSNDLVDQLYKEQEDFGENQESAAALKVDCDENVEIRIDSEMNSLSLERVNRNPTTEEKSPAKPKQENVPGKKLTSKEKAKKVPKFGVPGYSNRLTVKEKAILREVFFKYGLKAALDSKNS